MISYYLKWRLKLLSLSCNPWCVVPRDIAFNDQRFAIVCDLSRKQMGEDKTAVVVPKKLLCYTWECDNSDANGLHAVLLFLLSMGIHFFNMLYSYMACYWDIGSSSIPSPKHYLFCSAIYFWTKTNYRWKYYCINTCMTEWADIFHETIPITADVQNRVVHNYFSISRPRKSYNISQQTLNWRDQCDVRTVNIKLVITMSYQLTLQTWPWRNKAFTLSSRSRIANSASNNAPFKSSNFNLQA